MKYSLYYTFKDLPNKPLSKVDKKNLLKFLNTCTKDNAEVMLMLIAEHAKCEDNYDFTKMTKMPYKGKQEKDGVIFDLDKLPIKLQWILLKCSKILEKK